MSSTFRMPTTMCQFEMNEENSSQGGVAPDAGNFYVYTCWIATDAGFDPPQPCVVSFAGAGKPGNLIEIHASPMTDRAAVTVEFTSFGSLDGDAVSVVLAQCTATAYGDPANEPPPAEPR